MNCAQPLVSPAKAALIYLLEPAWCLLFSVLFGHDKLTQTLILGGVLILLGNLVPLVPVLGRKRPGKEDIPEG